MTRPHRAIPGSAGDLTLFDLSQALDIQGRYAPRIAFDAILAQSGDLAHALYLVSSGIRTRVSGLI